MSKKTKIHARATSFEVNSGMSTLIFEKRVSDEDGPPTKVLPFKPKIERKKRIPPHPIIEAARQLGMLQAKEGFTYDSEKRNKLDRKMEEIAEKLGNPRRVLGIVEKQIEKFEQKRGNTVPSMLENDLMLLRTALLRVIENRSKLADELFEQAFG